MVYRWWFPQCFRWFPRALDGSPRALDGFPRALDGFPRTIDGFLSALDGFPLALDGFPSARAQVLAAGGLLSTGHLSKDCTLLLPVKSIRTFSDLIFPSLCSRLYGLFGHIWFVDLDKSPLDKCPTTVLAYKTNFWFPQPYSWIPQPSGPAPHIIVKGGTAGKVCNILKLAIKVFIYSK